MATEVETKKKGAENEEEVGQKVALLSGKGILFVLILLALEGVIGLGAYLFVTRRGTSEAALADVAPTAEGQSLRVTVQDPEAADGRKNQVNVQIEFEVEVDRAARETIERQLKKVQPIVKAKVLDLILQTPPGSLPLITTKRDLEGKIKVLYNETIKMYSSAKDQEEMGDEPIQKIWFTSYQVQ